MTGGLTPEQRVAVERREGSLFLSAGAGSGKTRVLVERFVRAVLEDGVGVERILAITFTEKAAAELKGRLRKAFADRGEHEHARSAEAAFIGTIHGFCARLLRAHALAAGLDPEYAVLDASDAQRIAIAAFDTALEDFLLVAPDAERLDLVASYTPDKLRAMVLTVHSQLRARGEQHPVLPPVDAPTAGDERADLERAIAAARAEIGAADGKTVVATLDKLGRCEAALAAVAPGALGDIGEFVKTEVKPGRVGALQGPGVAAYIEARERWLTLCGGARAAQQYSQVQRLLAAYDGHYARLKRERSALDFEDLELLARDLLRDRPDVRAVWSERFQHVMVDEYQDTNELQDELIDLLAAGRLFAVGDDRQSIYGFRYADVAGFRERRRQAEAEDRAARLTVNFRSAPAVLEAVNVAFERVWGEDEYEPLAPGAEDESGAEGQPSVELLVVDHSKQHWEAAGLGDDAFGASLHRATIWRAAEARLLAARIDELVRGGDRFGWGDVAILMRAATDMQLYERALAERGIRTYAAGARGYFSQQQIGDLRAYLAALANPLDGVALYGLLASPLVGASLDALTLLRLHARAAGLDPWWALERAFGSGEGSADGAAAFVAALPAADRERLAAFVPRFAAERASAPRLSLETVIDRAQTASGYDRVVLAMPSGERRMANVRKLMRLAREFEGRSGRDLRRFIDYVDEQELIAAREGEAPLETESLDAVRLMTIHAAKGLEFPVVCVADMGRAGNDPATPLRVSNDGRLGLQIASMGGPGVSALDMDDLKAEEEARAEAEERRVFYVAMTRAERHLILSGATDVDKWPEAKPLGRPLDWAWRALVPELPQALGGDAEVTLTAALGERSAPVRCVVCSPETVDRVLPAADRAPAPGAGAGSGSAGAAEVGEPAFAPVQAPVSLPLARLSYSALEQYARCGYRFYLERVARLRDPELTAVPSEPAVGDLVPVAGDDEVGGAPRTDPWAVAAGDAASAGGQLGLPLAAAVEPDEPVAPGRLDARLRGTVAHELLERIDFDLPRGFSDEEIEARIAAHGSTVDPADVADQRAMVERFLGSEVCGRVRAALRVRKEVPFAFPLGTAGESILVNGVLDVHADEERGALVVDYKSDRLEGADPAAFCDEHYGTQRVVYALAALRAGAERVEVVHLFLERPADPVSVSFAATDAERLEDDLRALAGGVIEGRFEPTGDPHRDLCRGCPGRPALCSWDESRTLAPRGEFHPVAP